MRDATAVEALQNFDHLLDSVAQGPVAIRENDRDVAVMMSLQAWRRLTQQDVHKFQQLCDRVAADAALKGLDDSAMAELLRDDD